MNNSSFVWCKRTHSCLMPCPKGVIINQETHLVFSFISFEFLVLFIIIIIIIAITSGNDLGKKCWTEVRNEWMKIKDGSLDNNITRDVGSSDWKTRIRKYSAAD